MTTPLQRCSQSCSKVHRSLEKFKFYRQFVTRAIIRQYCHHIVADFFNSVCELYEPYFIHSKVYEVQAKNKVHKVLTSQLSRAGF